MTFVVDVLLFNKLAEKIFSVMNDKELETLLLSHYENESQTLTSGAEANLLKFKELWKFLWKFQLSIQFTLKNLS